MVNALNRDLGDAAARERFDVLLSVHGPTELRISATDLYLAVSGSIAKLPKRVG